MISSSKFGGLHNSPRHTPSCHIYIHNSVKSTFKETSFYSQAPYKTIVQDDLTIISKTESSYEMQTNTDKKNVSHIYIVPFFLLIFSAAHCHTYSGHIQKVTTNIYNKVNTDVHVKTDHLETH